MRILVTGRNGQVAQALAERGGAHELIFAARPELDLARPETIAPTLQRAKPDLIISAAAYTAVDQAEDEVELAMAVNGDAMAELGRAAVAIDAPVLHLSTDYVFDGSGDRAWREQDPVAPLGVYGQSKLAGEQALAQSGATWLVMRTAWVYSPFGKNFVKTMLQLAETRDALQVVGDQIGNPTSAFDIADGLIAVADHWLAGARPGANSIYHFAGSGDASWAQFAAEIFRQSEKQGGPHATVTPIMTSEYPTRAQRPGNSRLVCSLFERQFNFTIPPWQTSLAKVLERLQTVS